MRKRSYAGTAVLAAMALGGAGIATASSGPAETGSNEPAVVHSAPDASGSRLDDGADLLSQAKISEREAIAAAQTAASGPLNEIDLEDYQGQLVFNVDVGASDVKVDASNGDVLATPSDD
jgi:uncharacterized membrane protein YkoI